MVAATCKLVSFGRSINGCDAAEEPKVHFIIAEKIQSRRLVGQSYFLPVRTIDTYNNTNEDNGYAIEAS